MTTEQQAEEEIMASDVPVGVVMDALGGVTLQDEIDQVEMDKFAGSLGGYRKSLSGRLGSDEDNDSHKAVNDENALIESISRDVTGTVVLDRPEVREPDITEILRNHDENMVEYRYDLSVVVNSWSGSLMVRYLNRMKEPVAGPKEVLAQRILNVLQR